jgi:23S rRNA (cytosine1962-C5)-methyltransferase
VRRVRGEQAPETFTIRENGVRYEMSFNEGYSVGLFLDQRENRRRLLHNYVGPGFELFPGGLNGKRVLNTFAYTCGFSVCAAVAGAITTSLDLSKKYLEWGKRNFELNGIDAGKHDFIFGDVFEWCPRLAKKGRRFDLIVLDPPTFSRSAAGAFQAEKDYPKLVRTALPLLEPGGVLFCSSNAARFEAEDFVSKIKSAFAGSDHRLESLHYIPQPPDFPISRDEPGYLKTVWARVT